MLIPFPRLAPYYLAALLLPLSSPRVADPPPIERLTRDGQHKQHPAWSPDGKLLACTVFTKGKVCVGQWDPAASSWKFLRPVDENPEFEPDWSPDGKRIVFIQDVLQGTDGQLQLHVMNPDGSDAKLLVAPPKRPAQDEHPCWAPDGKSIAFTTTRDGNQEIYLCDADGSNLRRITSHPAIDSHPSWSPDGKQITFCSSRFGNMEICVMNADGSNIRRLTDHPSMDYQPKWSPDGRWIAFTSTRDGIEGRYEIYVIRPDGTGLRNLSRHVAIDKDPAWNRDGTALTFVSDRDARSDLYQIRLEPAGADSASH